MPLFLKVASALNHAANMPWILCSGGRQKVHGPIFFILIHFCTEITKIYILHLLLDLKIIRIICWCLDFQKLFLPKMTSPKLSIHGKTIFIVAEEKMFL
jgi:hypothetical protein